MNGGVGVPEFLSRARPYRHFLAGKLAEARALGETATSRANEVANGRAAACEECAALYLPDFGPVALATAARLLGLQQEWADERVRIVRAEDRTLERRVEEIEKDDRYQFRSSYVGEGGEWTSELSLCEKHLAAAREETSRWERLPAFLELIQHGYDTPSYSVGWWRPLYYRLWKHADSACDAFSKRSFSEVREEYLAARSVREQKAKKRDETRAKIEALDALLKERDAAIARRGALRGEAPLLDTRRVIAQRLAAADRRALAATAQAAGRQDLLAALARLDGLDAQANYLLSMSRDDEEARAIAAEISRLDSDIAKYSRPKKAGYMFDREKFERRFLAERIERRLARRRKFLDRAYEFDDYHDYDWNDPAPWWFYIVGRSDPGYGAAFPDVSSFLGQRPGYAWRPRVRSQDDYDAAAAALASSAAAPDDRDVS